jgi:hypothetical protein
MAEHCGGEFGMDYSIILDHLSAYENSGNKQFSMHYISWIKETVDKYNKYCYALNLVDEGWGLVCPAKKPSTLLYKVIHPDFEKALIKTENPLILAAGSADRKRAFLRRIPYLTANHWFEIVLHAYLSNDDGFRQRLLQKLVDEARRLLEIMECSSIVLWNDRLFIERVLAVAAHLENIPVLVVQHGLYQKHTSAEHFDGLLADCILVWGNHFADLVQQKKMADKDRLFVLGYPWIMPEDGSLNKTGFRGQTKDLCVVSSGHIDYDTSRGVAEMETLVSICKEALALGYDVTYRPHPNQWKKPYPPNLDCNVRIERNCSVQESIKHHDIFIGIDSTVLVETALYGKITVQVLIPEIECDNFAEQQICYSVPYRVDDLKNILNEIKLDRLIAMPWNDYFIKRRYHFEDFSSVFSDAVASCSKNY